MSRLITALVVPLALIACQSLSAPTLQHVKRGATAALGLRERAIYDGRLDVQFTGVIEDTRCPRDVSCVWAGEVKVELMVRIDAAEPKSYETTAGRPIAIDAYRVTVIEVHPQPLSDRKIAPQDYRIVLKAE